MNFYKEGDKSQAICSHCKKRVSTTFQVRTTSILDEGVKYTVPDILVGVCDICGIEVSIPQQSFAAIGEVKKKKKKRSLDVRLPRHLLDILNHSILKLGIDVSSDLRSQLVRVYLGVIFNDTKQIKKLSKNLESDLLIGKFKRSSRLTLSLSSDFIDNIKTLEEQSGIQSQTDLIDSIIISIKKDIIEKENFERFYSVQKAMVALAG